MSFIDAACLVVGIATVVIQIIVFSNIVKTENVLKEKAKRKLKEIPPIPEEPEMAETDVNLPEWVEKFIDNYMANASKDNHQ